MPYKTPPTPKYKTRNAKHSSSTTHAKAGDSLWSIAERTLPKGKSLESWFGAIKKMNTVNGKLRKLNVGTGVSLPNQKSDTPAAYDMAGMPGPNYMGPNPTRTPKKTGRGMGR
jgi:Tfp pilus assembly protein FimV